MKSCHCPCTALPPLLFSFFLPSLFPFPPFSLTTPLLVLHLSPELSLVFGQTTDTGTLSFTVSLGSVSNWQPGRGVRVQGRNFSHTLPSESAPKMFVSLTHSALTERVSTTETLNRCIPPPFAPQVISSKCAHIGMSQRGGCGLDGLLCSQKVHSSNFQLHSHTLLL